MNQSKELPRKPNNFIHNSHQLEIIRPQEVEEYKSTELLMYRSTEVKKYSNNDEMDRIEVEVLLREEYFAMTSPFNTFTQAYTGLLRPVKVITAFLSWSEEYGVSDVAISSKLIGEFCQISDNSIRALLSRYVKLGYLDRIKTGSNISGKASIYRKVKENV